MASLKTCGSTPENGIYEDLNMVTVKTLKKFGRIPKGAIGTISDREFEAFGVGELYVYPHKCAFYYDGQEASIENIYLEVVQDAPRQSQRKPKEQLRMSFA